MISPEYKPDPTELLALIYAEVMDSPANRPFSSDSYLPAHIVEMIQQHLKSVDLPI